MEIDISFSVSQIVYMLEEYEIDYQTGMDVQAIAEQIYKYTLGYPVLVSLICKYINKELSDEEGIESFDISLVKREGGENNCGSGCVILHPEIKY